MVKVYKDEEIINNKIKNMINNMNVMNYLDKQMVILSLKIDNYNKNSFKEVTNKIKEEISTEWKKLYNRKSSSNMMEKGEKFDSVIEEKKYIDDVVYNLETKMNNINNKIDQYVLNFNDKLILN